VALNDLKSRLLGSTSLVSSRHRDPPGEVYPPAPPEYFHPIDNDPVPPHWTGALIRREVIVSLVTEDPR
jgi:hypothetical protein